MAKQRLYMFFSVVHENNNNNQTLGERVQVHKIVCYYYSHLFCRGSVFLMLCYSIFLNYFPDFAALVLGKVLFVSFPV